MRPYSQYLDTHEVYKIAYKIMHIPCPSSSDEQQLPVPSATGSAHTNDSAVSTKWEIQLSCTSQKSVLSFCLGIKNIACKRDLQWSRVRWSSVWDAVPCKLQMAGPKTQKRTWGHKVNDPHKLEQDDLGFDQNFVDILP